MDKIPLRHRMYFVHDTYLYLRSPSLLTAAPAINVKVLHRARHPSEQAPHDDLIGPGLDSMKTEQPAALETGAQGRSSASRLQVPVCQV